MTSLEPFVPIAGKSYLTAITVTGLGNPWREIEHLRPFSKLRSKTTYVSYIYLGENVLTRMLAWGNGEALGAITAAYRGGNGSCHAF